MSNDIAHNEAMCRRISRLVDGKRIASLAFDSANGGLAIVSENGYRLEIRDHQDCFERRYMTCDDDLASYVGAMMMSISVSISVEAGPNRPTDDGEHEIAFLRIATDAGTLVVCTHNEHNGFYSGFDIRADVIDPDGNATRLCIEEEDRKEEDDDEAGDA